MTIGLALFVVGSFGLVLLSIRSFLNPLSHGFPRFFAFEAILGLILLNALAWFRDPLSLLQLISWELLIDSALLAGHAFWVLNRYGKPDPSHPDTSLLGVEKTTRLVTEGPYHFIRHPLYASLLCLAWGAFLKQVTLLSVMLVVLASVALVAAAIIEERENLERFGDSYAEYMKVTKRLIPFVY